MQVEEQGARGGALTLPAVVRGSDDLEAARFGHKLNFALLAMSLTHIDHGSLSMCSNLFLQTHKKGLRLLFLTMSQDLFT